MSNQERNAQLAICFLAALADGGSSEAEQADVRRAVAGATESEVAQVYQDVLTGKRTLKGCAGELLSPQTREEAFEMAVGVCAADEGLSERERSFLEQLREALGVPPSKAAGWIDEAQQLALAPVMDRTSSAAGTAPRSTLTVEQIDGMIHKAAVTNGALELLPNSLATMAIVPLQMRLVYKIGKSYGYSLDRGHVKDFLATIGVGMTGQVVEKYATRLVGRLLKGFGGIGGGLVRGATRQATSSAFSYASTYALGHAAKQYYSGGRKLSSVELRSTFEGLFRAAKGQQDQHAGEIEAAAGRVRLRDVLPALKDG